MYMAQTTRVFERPRTQHRQAGIDAGRIAFEQRTLGRRQARECGLGAGRETVQPVGAVEGHGAWPEQFGQLAARRAAQQVHLEEAFLGVHEAGRICHV
jgi:hypothetical protein